MGIAQPVNRAELVSMCCCNCGIEFAVPSYWDVRRREDHKTMWCPNGHEQSYKGKTVQEIEIARLRADLALEKQNREWAESRRRSADIQRGKAEAKAKRLTTRVHSGVCPHCNRTFSQLARHMQSQHAAMIAEHQA